MDRFHVQVEQKLRAFTKLSLRDCPPLATVASTEDNLYDPKREKGPIAAALGELFGPEAPVGKLFERICGGADAQLHDWYALRTEPGSPRQPLHYDTPHQETPALFAAFIALQDVEVAMGPTMFLPGTHLRSSLQRREYDLDRTGGLGRCDAMLAVAAPRFAQLNAGDLVLFDMRILHAGTTNELGTGRQRMMLCVTFRNTAANECVLGHKPCIRPAYFEQITLRSLRSTEQMSLLGSGLPA